MGLLFWLLNCVLFTVLLAPSFLFPFPSPTSLVSFSHFIHNMNLKSHNDVYFVSLGIIKYLVMWSLRIYVNYLQNINVIAVIFWHLLICVLGTNSNFSIRMWGSLPSHMVTGKTRNTFLFDFCLIVAGNKIYIFGKHLPLKWNHLCLAKNRLKWTITAGKLASIFHELLSTPLILGTLLFFSRFSYASILSIKMLHFFSAGALSTLSCKVKSHFLIWNC